MTNCTPLYWLSTVLASSGIDYDIKIWTPSGDEDTFDVVKAHEVSFTLIYWGQDKMTAILLMTF